MTPLAGCAWYTSWGLTFLVFVRGCGIMLVTRCHMSHKTSNPCWALRRVGRRNLGAWPAQLNQSLSGAVPVVTAYVGPVPLRTCQPRAECWARTCAPAHTDSCRVAISRGAARAARAAARPAAESVRGAARRGAWRPRRPTARRRTRARRWTSSTASACAWAASATCGTPTSTCEAARSCSSLSRYSTARLGLDEIGRGRYTFGVLIWLSGTKWAPWAMSIGIGRLHKPWNVRLAAKTSKRSPQAFLGAAAYFRGFWSFYFFWGVFVSLWESCGILSDRQCRRSETKPFGGMHPSCLIVSKASTQEVSTLTHILGGVTQL